MAKAYVNKRDKFLWDNSFKPEDKVPVPSVSDEGKAIVVNDDGDYVLDKVATDTIYFDLRVDTSDYSITVTDTDYTVAEINDLARTYTTTILLRVQYDENNIYRLFRLYRVENWVTKWNDTVSVAEDDLVTINNDLINMQNDGTVRIYRRSIDNTMYNYSTTEHVVGTWIDGRSIYEKTICIETATLSSSSPYMSSVLDIPIDMMFPSEMIAKQGTTRVYGQVSYWNNISVSTARITADNKIQLSTSSSSSITWTDICVTIRYTKTTD